MAKFKKNQIREIDLRPKFNLKAKLRKAYLFFLGGLFLVGSFVIGGYANNIQVEYKKISLKTSRASLQRKIKREMEIKIIYNRKKREREKQQETVNKIICEIATMNAKISVAKNKAINHRDIVDSMKCVNRPDFFIK